MASILILGASGYVGSAVARHLSERGHQVTGMDLEMFGDPGGAIRCGVT